MQISGGTPALLLVGLPDKAAGEACERMRAALSAIGLSLPPRRVLQPGTRGIPRDGWRRDRSMTGRCPPDTEKHQLNVGPHAAQRGADREALCRARGPRSVQPRGTLIAQRLTKKCGRGRRVGAQKMELSRHKSATSCAATSDGQMCSWSTRARRSCDAPWEPKVACSDRVGSDGPGSSVVVSLPLPMRRAGLGGAGLLRK